jgi:hypothetical protein
MSASPHTHAHARSTVFCILSRVIPISIKETLSTLWYQEDCRQMDSDVLPDWGAFRTEGDGDAPLAAPEPAVVMDAPRWGARDIRIAFISFSNLFHSCTAFRFAHAVRCLVVDSDPSAVVCAALCLPLQTRLHARLQERAKRSCVVD